MNRHSVLQVMLPHHSPKVEKASPQMPRMLRQPVTMANVRKAAAMRRPASACRARQNAGKSSVQKCGLLDIGENKSINVRTMLNSRL